MNILITDICLRKITPRLLNVTLPFQFFGISFPFSKLKITLSETLKIIKKEKRQKTVFSIISVLPTVF